MSIYNFAPSPSIAGHSSDVATWVDGFSSEEIDGIVEYAESKLSPAKAIIGGKGSKEDYDEIRKSKTSWIEYNQETAWLYDRLAYIARQSNAQNWQFDLTGFQEDLQYTLYDEKDSHYTWHIDTIKSPGLCTRKLSLVLQLSDPIDYEGGEFELKTGPSETVIAKQKGLVMAFPSYTLHRVTPVTSGIRRSLVVWVSGPPFK